MRFDLILAVLLLGVLSGGCEDRSASPAPSPTPNTPRDPATGETRLRISVGEEAADLRSGATVPLALPPGFSIYPGSKVLGNTRVERSSGQRMLVEFETPDPIAKVVLFHRAQAEAAGVLLTLDLDGDTAASIGGRTVTGGDFALTARRTGGRTLVELAISDGSSRAER